MHYDALLRLYIEQEIEQPLKRQAFAQVSLMSFIQPPLLVSHGFAVSVSGPWTCAVCVLMCFMLK